MYKSKLQTLINNENYKEAISFLDEYCEKFPEELDCKFDLAMLLVNTSVFIDGSDDALDLLNEILVKNKSNLYALLLKGYIENTQKGQIEGATFKELVEFKSINNTSIVYIEQLTLLQALYYSSLNTEKYILHLKKSIEEDPYSSSNYILLGKKLIEIGDVKEGVNNLKKGINNVVEIFDNEKNSYNPISFEEFINEKIRGISITKPNYEFIIDLVEKQSQN